ncbi:MAG: hypothetical protein ABI340_09135 [Nitrososphaera sp.]
MTRKFSEPETAFHFDNIPAVLNGKTSTVINFWKWAYSDLTQNVTRGMVGQYIVAWALGVDDMPDDRWASFDLSINGKRVEVKTTSYLQAWKQKKVNPQFTIRKTHHYSRESGYSKESDFQADIYVLCYFFEKDEKIADVTNLSQWKFWVFSRNVIEELFKNRKTIAVSKLEKEFNSVLTPNLGKTILSCKN